MRNNNVPGQTVSEQPGQNRCRSKSDQILKHYFEYPDKIISYLSPTEDIWTRIAVATRHSKSGQALIGKYHFPHSANLYLGNKTAQREFAIYIVKIFSKLSIGSRILVCFRIYFLFLNWDLWH